VAGEGAGARGALLLLDFQKDFLDVDGRMPVDPSQVEPLIAATLQAVAASLAAGDLIVLIGNEFPRHDLIGNLLRHRAAMKGSAGAAWDSRIDPPGAPYIPKWKSSAFCNPALAATLHDARVARVCLAGLYTRACISATARAAQKRGLLVQVIGGATACSSDTSRQNALDTLRRVGIDVV
jgi:nicotinamidase-related amidase